MDEMDALEPYFRQYARDLTAWVPEGVIEVDLALLHRLDLLHYHSEEAINPGLTRYFQVSESYDKITLINDQFIVWIVPDVDRTAPITYTLIALKTAEAPHLELAFVTRGVYNNSKLVLRILEKFLWDIEENQQLLAKLGPS